MQNGASCAPVTDYFGYANRVVDPTLTNLTNDSWGSCIDCFTVIDGCTDPNATNYNPLASVDDNSCLYAVTFTVDMNCYADAFANVYVTGPLPDGVEIVSHYLMQMAMVYGKQHTIFLLVILNISTM